MKKALKPVPFVKGDNLAVSVTTNADKNKLRQMKGIAPISPPDEDQLNSALWYIWKSSNRSKRRHHIQQSKIKSLCTGFIGVDSALLKSLSW